MNGCTFLPAYELIRMTEPPPRSMRWGAVAITVFQTPVTLISM
jgi:hypothetical protein